MIMGTDPASFVQRHVWQDGQLSTVEDQVATETPVAIVFNGISHVVMMTTPSDLEDFALGFSLSEGILETAGQLLDLEEISTDKGIELHASITAKQFAGLKDKRRNLVGRTGCGICGAESLEIAAPSPKLVKIETLLSHAALQRAIVELSKLQDLQKKTGAVHAAAWCSIDGDILLIREDVGRHNALDKLIGARARGKFNDLGFALVTSRASYEMVSKAANANMPILASVSAPTSLAIELAEGCGITLVGFSRRNRHVIYANEQRLVSE